MSWTDERIATLKKMWEGGSTASQIADELGGVSRNAVIGKAHRLGLKSRPSPVKANEKKKPAVKAKAGRKEAGKACSETRSGRSNRSGEACGGLAAGARCLNPVAAPAQQVFGPAQDRFGRSGRFSPSGPGRPAGPYPAGAAAPTGTGQT